jgi:hypothetical protein
MKSLLVGWASHHPAARQNDPPSKFPSLGTKTVQGVIAHPPKTGGWTIRGDHSKDTGSLGWLGDSSAG